MYKTIFFLCLSISFSFGANSADDSPMMPVHSTSSLNTSSTKDIFDAIQASVKNDNSLNKELQKRFCFQLNCASSSQESLTVPFDILLKESGQLKEKTHKAFSLLKESTINISLSDSSIKLQKKKALLAKDLNKIYDIVALYILTYPSKDGKIPVNRSFVEQLCDDSILTFKDKIGLSKFLLGDRRNTYEAHCSFFKRENELQMNKSLYPVFKPGSGPYSHLFKKTLSNQRRFIYNAWIHQFETQKEPVTRILIPHCESNSPEYMNIVSFVKVFENPLTYQGLSLYQLQKELNLQITD